MCAKIVLLSFLLILIIVVFSIVVDFFQITTFLFCATIRVCSSRCTAFAKLFGLREKGMSDFAKTNFLSVGGGLGLTHRNQMRCFFLRVLHLTHEHTETPKSGSCRCTTSSEFFTRLTQEPRYSNALCTFCMFLTKFSVKRRVQTFFQTKHTSS